TFFRPELEKLLKYCNHRRGEVNQVIVYKWDRFGRNVGEAFDTIRKFKEMGVEVNCPDSQIDFQDPNWPVLLGVTFGIAQSESLKISDRTKDGIYQANSEGYYTATAPVGYMKKVMGKRSIMSPHPEKAPIV